MSHRFRLVMPGNPISWNHMYNRIQRSVPSADGGTRKIAVMAKTPEANLYQAQLTMLVRAAKPSDFKPEGQIIVAFTMYLQGNMDADNVLKACNDAIAVGLGVNDKRFIPVVLAKHINAKDPRLDIDIYDGQFWKPEVVPCS